MPDPVYTLIGLALLYVVPAVAVIAFSVDMRRQLLRPTGLLAWALAVGASVALLAIIGAWIDDRTVIIAHWQGRRVELLEPRAFYLVAIVPFFFLVRAASLTDLSLAQQLLQT
ncbi:MAG: hypothetical protein KC464_21815, partial [Myxococcales bacterium]|nr:hypothetical protein [Myxococcales bacterium]